MKTIDEEQINILARDYRDNLYCIVKDYIHEQ